ncbi:MAG: aspartate kinase [Gammaproteobacteria bacterium]|nr:MAG: aspartate kinase [Gammaproteobacteria bacterium]
MTRVFKFGGALMKDADGIRRVASIVADYQLEPLVVIVSALGKTTNSLEELLGLSRIGDQKGREKVFIKLRKYHFEMADDLIEDARHIIFDQLDELFVLLNKALKETPADKYFHYDQVVGFGEQLSSLIVSAYLQKNGQATHLVNAHTLIVTDSNYTAAKIDWKLTENTIKSRVLPILENGEIVITQGFIGADHKGLFTTLGREGSDFTAAIFANVLDADEACIWKDVPGLMNADPKRFDDSVKLDNISYHEAIELAFYGASVVHPKTIQPVQHKNIPLKIRSFYEPESEATVINSETSKDNQVHKVIVKDNQVLLSIASRDLAFIAEENLTRIFKAFSRNKIHINLMQHSAVSFSVCFNEDDDKLQALMAELKEAFRLTYNTGLTLITIRHYTNELLEEFTSGKNIFLEQKSRSTVQVLVG